MDHQGTSPLAGPRWNARRHVPDSFLLLVRQTGPSRTRGPRDAWQGRAFPPRYRARRIAWSSSGRAGGRTARSPRRSRTSRRTGGSATRSRQADSLAPRTSWKQVARRNTVAIPPRGANQRKTDCEFISDLASWWPRDGASHRRERSIPEGRRDWHRQSARDRAWPVRPHSREHHRRRMSRGMSSPKAPGG